MPKNNEKKERLERLQHALAKHPNGKALLDFARDIKISIRLSDAMPGELFGRADDKKARIHLNAKHDDHILLSILYHELRHVQQHHDGLFLHSGPTDGQIHNWPVRDPYAFFVLNRIAEGDAYARQVEFAFEHGPDAQAAMARHCAPVFNAYAAARAEHPNDRESALLCAFAAFTRTTADEYDRTCLDQLSQRLERYERLAAEDPGLARSFFAVASKFPLTSGLIREYAKLGPDTNYLAAVHDAALNGLARVKPQTGAELSALEKRYNDFFSRFDGGGP